MGILIDKRNFFYLIERCQLTDSPQTDDQSHCYDFPEGCPSCEFLRRSPKIARLFVLYQAGKREGSTLE
ncbi:MAG: hypothetical protein KKF68_00720 [Nanoarchaeota archaeon]|nr:hypothetical protein [Nanoarchaeota archaeon]